jgi:hypothetical protein
MAQPASVNWPQCLEIATRVEASIALDLLSKPGLLEKARKEHAELEAE